MSGTVRLNTRIRKIILERVLQHAFGVPEAALQADRKVFGRDVYNDVYHALVRQKMKELGDDFFKWDNDIGVTIVGVGRVDIELGDNYPLAFEHYGYHKAVKEYAKDNELNKRFVALQKRKTALEKERESMEAEVNGVLNSVQTIGALAKAWPAAASFFSDFKPTTPQGGALARDLRKLNQSLGLPPTVPTTP